MWGPDPSRMVLAPHKATAAMQHWRPLRVDFDGSRPKETSLVATDRLRIGAP
jgi:hypothetical protein